MARSDGESQLSTRIIFSSSLLFPLLTNLADVMRNEKRADAPPLDKHK